MFQLQNKYFQVSTKLFDYAAVLIWNKKQTF